MKQIEVNKQPPVISMNFEEVKASLAETVYKYRGIIVTEEGLQDCKATQKSLAGIRTKIDSYRKEIKKEMSKPINDFESKCKELIKLVEEAEEPIKEGITIFDNKKREEKRQVAKEIIEKAIVEHQLNEKYASKLNVLDKYINLTTKPSDVKRDVEQRVFILLQEQNKEMEMLEIINDTITNANKSLKTLLKLEDFQNLFNMNIPANKIIQEINKRAELIKEAERAANNVNEVKEVNQEPSEPLEQKENEPLYYVNMKVIGSYNDIVKLGQYLKDSNYNYTKLSTGKVE
ncbi:MAG: DUF1351 domain-containing protein [Clostridiaceae bacterium]